MGIITSAVTFLSDHKMGFSISSPAFTREGNIPARYTQEGENISPPLEIWNAPLNCRSFVLLMQDPDSPTGTYDHWLMWNIPVCERIRENSVQGVFGRNSSGVNAYCGPLPTEEKHHYFIKIFALDTRSEEHTSELQSQSN